MTGWTGAIQVAVPERNGYHVDPRHQRTRCSRCTRFHEHGFCPALMEMPGLPEGPERWERIADPICRRAECGCPTHALADLVLLDVYLDGWRRVRFTRTELALLCALLPPWKLASQYELLLRTWGAGAIVSETGRAEAHLLRVNVARLRAKLPSAWQIETAHGVGYKLRPRIGVEP